MPSKSHFKFTIFLILDVNLRVNEIHNNRIANSVLHFVQTLPRHSLLSKCHLHGTCVNIILIYAHGESTAFPAKIFMILINAQQHNMQNRKQSRAITVPIFMKFTITQ